MGTKMNPTMVGAICVALLALAACRPEEQGRPLQYKPGVYLGENKSAELTEDQLADLRQRALEQADSDVSGAAAGIAPADTTSSVRPPESPADKELNDRLKMQSGN